jgi:hypothetical protein
MKMMRDENTHIKSTRQLIGGRRKKDIKKIFMDLEQRNIVIAREENRQFSHGSNVVEKSEWRAGENI